MQDRKEFMAIPIVLAVLGVLFLVMFAATEGVWAWILLGLALLALLAAALVVAGRRRRHPSELEAPVTPAPRQDGTFRLLVVCDESCTSPAFHEALLRHAGDRPVEALVVAPALGSRLTRWTGDDRGRVDAEDHLQSTLRSLADAGIGARGVIGSDDPIEAADDALREFPADELVFATHPEAQANWLERDVVEVARARYDLPVRHVVVDPA
jgi:GABA permease